MKFSEKKLDKMIPGSRQWEDQVGRVDYGGKKEKDITMLQEVADSVKQKELVERRILRHLWMHNSRM